MWQHNRQYICTICMIKDDIWLLWLWVCDFTLNYFNSYLLTTNLKSALSFRYFSVRLASVCHISVTLQRCTRLCELRAVKRALMRKWIRISVTYGKHLRLWLANVLPAEKLARPLPHRDDVNKPLPHITSNKMAMKVPLESLETVYGS